MNSAKNVFIENSLDLYPHQKFYDQMKTTIGYVVCFFAIMTILPCSQLVAQKKQSNKELLAEIEKWKVATNEATARAVKAEANAVRLEKMVIATQQMAENAEAAANRARYLAQAKAMSVKSTE